MWPWHESTLDRSVGRITVCCGYYVHYAAVNERKSKQNMLI